MSALDALQLCLAAEHAAVYGYGVVGGVLARFPDQLMRQADADRSYAAHRAARDSLTELIAGLGEQPVAAAAAYDVEGRLADPSSCRKLAQQIEERTAYVYGIAVSQTVGRSRARCADALTACALRRQTWGGAAQALPGLDES